MLENASGHRCATTVEAYDYEFAAVKSGGSDKDVRQQLSMLQRFLSQCCEEKQTVEEEDDTAAVHEVVATSALEDWLWRGGDAIVRDLSSYVYSMWVSGWRNCH